MPFAEYLSAALLEPLGLGGTELRGSPASEVFGPLPDLLRWGRELLAPSFVAPETYAEATAVAFPGLSGVLPGFGRQEPLDWGLGFELKDGKSPHWTGSRNSPQTFGHFGGAGTFLWVDPGRGPRARLPHRPRVRRVGRRGVAPVLGRRPRGARVSVAVLGLGGMGSRLPRARLGRTP